MDIEGRGWRMKVCILSEPASSQWEELAEVNDDTAKAYRRSEREWARVNGR